MAKAKYGFIYIQSNDKISGLVKIGITYQNPLKRVVALSRATGVPGKYQLEWYQDVPDAPLAERLIQYKLQAFHSSKEFYEIPVEKAERIVTDLISKLFHASSNEEKYLAKIEGKKFFDGIGKLDISWELLIPTYKNSICKEGIRLCLSEGKKGDPARSRFISYRSNFKGMKVVHLFFQAKHISVVIEGDRGILLNHIIAKFTPKHLIDFTETAAGYNLKIVNKTQFAKLVNWLGMGKK
jgi:hypothetical protein